MKPAGITRMLQSRGIAVLIACLCTFACWWACYSGVTTVISGDRGIAFPSPNLWLSDRDASLWTGLSLNLLIAILMVVLNRMHNFIRSISVVFATLFMLMQVSTPDTSVQFYGGQLLAVVALAAMMMLFSCYGGAGGNRRIFLIFFLPVLGCTCLYCMAYLMPIFIIGLLQMRVFAPRTLVAAGIGIITPAWILVGLGIVDPTTLSMPHFTGIFSGIDDGETVHLLLIATVTTAICIAAWIMNFTKVIAYNARNRAYNGFLSMLSCATIIMMIIDYSSLLIYLPLLNVCAAYQAGHFIAVRRPVYGYIYILSLIAIYLSFYLWRILV